jgi:hypothetical protein
VEHLKCLCIVSFMLIDIITVVPFHSTHTSYEVSLKKITAECGRVYMII